MEVYYWFMMLTGTLLAIVCGTNLIPTNTSESILDRVAITLLWLSVSLEYFTKL